MNKKFIVTAIFMLVLGFAISSQVLYRGNDGRTMWVTIGRGYAMATEGGTTVTFPYLQAYSNPDGSCGCIYYNSSIGYLGISLDCTALVYIDLANRKYFFYAANSYYN